MPELKDHPAVGEATRLYEKLSDLFRSTNSVNAAPSPAQRVYFDELTEAFGRREGDVRTYLESVAALNDALAAEGLPELLVPRP